MTQPALFTLEPVCEEIACCRWRSQARPEIIVTNERWDLPVLRWADAHPVVYEIATGCRSKAYGVGSCAHAGWAQRANTPEAVFERIRTIYDDVHDPLKGLGIFRWRALFTLEHYRDKGFTGGTFAAVLPREARSSVLTMDYTPDLVLDVAQRFAAWVDQWRELVAVVVLKGCEEVYRWDWSAMGLS